MAEFQDNAARKQRHPAFVSGAADVELRPARIQLTQLQRLSHAGCFTADLAVREPVLSDELYRILELDPTVELGAQALRELVHRDDLPVLLASFEDSLVAGLDFDHVFRIVTPKGTIKYLRCIWQLVETEGAHPLIVGSILDLTESRNVQQALKISDGELRRAHAQLSEAQRICKTGSFTSDLQQNVHEWSDEYYRIFELDRSTEPSVEAVRERVHPEDLPVFDAQLRNGLAGGESDFTFRVVTASGALKYLRGVARLIEHVAGRPIFVGTVQDVTESKLSEAALVDSRAELLLANSYLLLAQRLSKTGSFTWDLTTGERQWSEEMYRIFETDPNAPVPFAQAEQVVHPDDLPVFQALVARARAGQDLDAEFRLVTPRGAIKQVHVVGHLVGHTKERPVFVGALQDVTDRNAAEEALDRARCELAHVARVTALGALSASIAHEVNQPLSGIIANASACLHMLATDPPQIERARVTAERMARDGKRASEVIARLRALFAGKHPGKETVDLNDAAREVLVLSSSELHGARVALHTDFDANLPAVLGDRVQLQQVVLNLVLNAAQAMRGIEGRAHDLRISTALTNTDEVMLSVRDCGVGTTVENLEQLFRAFHTTKPDGMGVGLSISRSIVETHGGRLWASVNEGPGLTLSFSLPSAARSVKL